MTPKKRSKFSSKIGFVLAAAGSAVGLGNIWRFPYLAAEYGGGTFLLVYLILAVTFGFAMMITEIALGRKTRRSAIEAYPMLDGRFGFLGILTTLVPVLILPYYSVIGGWVIKYFAVFLTGQGQAAAADNFFSGFTGETAQPLVWFLIFILVTSVVVMLGVEKGIEKVSMVLMPVLVILSVVIALYAVTRPGALAGVVYYLKPDLSKLTGKTVLAALGQLFYSMSLAMGIMITYGSYMKRSANLEKSVRQIEIFDTAIAFLAGLMIVPAVFTFSGGDESAMSAGPGLMFITLPKVFESMPGGSLVGALFFLLVLFAALTSSISLMETIVSILQDKLKWNRQLSTVIVTLFCIAVGIPSSLGFGIWSGVQPLGMSILDFFDFTSNSVLMPVVAFCTCIFVGFVIKPQAVIEEVEQDGVSFKAKRFYAVLIKYLAPIGIIAILISSIAAGLGLFTW